MGNNHANSYTYYRNPDENPFDKAPNEFDPLFGFKEGERIPKVPRVTMGEIENCKIEFHQRNFCIHKWIESRVCVRKEFPLMYKCQHYWHDFAKCKNEEYLDRARDYERERRLLRRRKRIMKKQAEMKEIAAWEEEKRRRQEAAAA